MNAIYMIQRRAPSTVLPFLSPSPYSSFFLTPPCCFLFSVFSFSLPLPTPLASGGTTDVSGIISAATALTTNISGLSSAAASALSGAGISNTASALSAASSVLSQATGSSSRAASSSARSSSAAASGSSAAASASSSAFNAAIAGHSVSSSVLVGLTTVTAGLLTGAWATFF
ncbi:hypothetical protein EV421DRAFT_85706 [Armillaria borealis]|uniref:Uncharacterized protein n=1 Tax=Armillaria borealis TaxID=47425 RepID=A0AA39N4A3_9AGAR|nr:hypothetical protein EV421DRAFT_85706 [Armillaria borealis]